MRLRYVLAVIILSRVLQFDGANAALTTNSWTSGVSSKWETAGDWSAGAPTITHSANLITNATSKTVTIDAATTVGTLTISNLVISGPAGTVNALQLTNAPSSTLHILNSLVMANGGVLTISNSTVRVDASSGTLSVLDGSVFLQSGSLVVTNSATWISQFDSGSLTISNGTAQFGIFYLGVLGGAGTLTVAGGTNQLFSSLNTAIQMDTTGTVWVTGGQLVVTNDSTFLGGAGYGQVTVSNGAALLNDLYIGNYPGAAGALKVAGGIAQLSSFLSIGSETGAMGVVQLTGGQLFSTNDDTHVGDTGIGQMTVSNGTWLANEVFVGYHPGSQGTLTIAGGTTVLSSDLFIGGEYGSTGTLWMTGGQLFVTNNVSFLQVAAVGQMTISNGTCLAATMYLGGEGTEQGTLTIAGGTVTVLTDLYVGYGGTQTLWLKGGQLNVINGATGVGFYDSGHMTISNGIWGTRNVIVGGNPGSVGTLTVAGGVSLVYSNVTIGNTNCTAGGIVLINGGELHVTNDDATATLEVRNGILIQTGGVLDIDRIVVTNPCAHFIHMGGTLIYGLQTLDPRLDADGDGIPNGYEMANGLDPLDPNDASADPDGDGMSNLQEYLAGTDPFDPHSVFRITTVTHQGNDIRVTWTTVGGRTNQVYLNTPAVGGGITDGISPLGPLFIIPGTGESTTNYLDIGGATNKPSRYYRVRLVP